MERSYVKWENRSLARNKSGSIFLGSEIKVADVKSKPETIAVLNTDIKYLCTESIVAAEAAD